MSIIAQLRAARLLLIEMNLGTSKMAKDLDEIIIRVIRNLMDAVD